MHETCRSIKQAIDANEHTYALILIAKYMEEILKMVNYRPVKILEK